MNDPATLSKAQLLELVNQQQAVLAKNERQLEEKEAGLIDRQHQLAESETKVTEQEKQLTEQEKQLTEQEKQLTEQEKQLTQKSDIIKQLEQELEKQKREYLKLWRERFEARSERYIADADQLRLDFGDTDEAADAVSGLSEAIEEADLIPAHRRRKPRKGNHAFPAHLPRQEEIIDADDSQKYCDTHGEKQPLPESMCDVTEKMIYVPSQCYVLVRKYLKYVCPGCPSCGVASAERPTGIVEGDKYDTSVAAQIITNKFAYHLPLYRQQDIFAGSGWSPSRSLMLNILMGCFFIIQPLLEYFKRTLQGDSVVACDDTGVTLLYPKVPPDFDLSDPKQKRAAEVYAAAREQNKPSINAKIWAYRGVNVKLNVFDFTVSRHRDGPELFFQDFAGKILGDCWHGFEAIAASSDGAIERVGCNSHARRKFESVEDYPADRRKWMNWFQELFDLESEAREQSLVGEQLREHRQQAKPIWEAMRQELDAIEDRTEQVVLPKSDLRKALNYLRNHWTELTRYLDDPELPIDNNECEQLMKQTAVGRKNWLFQGSLAGGERNAGFMTLVSSAHRNDLDVWAYVNDVLKRLLAGETDYEPLLPWNWKAEHPESIRTYRQTERRDREIRKREKRQKRRAEKKRYARRNRK